MKVLENTFIIGCLSPFYKNPRTELVKTPKVYFMDCGLRNYLLSDFKGFSKRGDKGQLVEPELVLASGDLIAIDIEAMKVLLTYEAKNKLIADPWQSPQIATASKHGLGTGESGYIVVQVD